MYCVQNAKLFSQSMNRKFKASEFPFHSNSLHDISTKWNKVTVKALNAKVTVFTMQQRNSNEMHFILRC